MTAYIHRVSLVVAAAVVAACGADRSASSHKSAVLSDARSDGAAGFYFLPPVAPEPGSGTVNDRGLSPVVEIAPVDAPDLVLARFEGDQVKESGSHYMVHWSTRRFVPALGTTYRIRVLLDGEELGFADAQVAKNGRELHLLGSEEIFGLTGQRTVPIKFRIHVQPPGDLCEGVVCGEPAACEALACNPATGACESSPQADGTACEDGDPCTVEDVCAAGVCGGGDALACAGDQCNVGVCTPGVGCTTVPVEDSTNCTAASGFGGYCETQQDGVSICIESGGGKLSR